MLAKGVEIVSFRQSPVTPTHSCAAKIYPEEGRWSWRKSWKFHHSPILTYNTKTYLVEEIEWRPMCRDHTVW